MSAQSFLVGFMWFTFIVCLVVWLSTSIFVVKQKTAAIVEVFGKFSSVKSAGLNFKLPWPIARVASTVNLQIGQLSPNVTVKSKDNAFLVIPVKLQYKVMEDKIKEANYELDNPEEQIESYVLNMIRSKSSEYTMDELFSVKDSFDTEVKESLNEKFSSYGYKVVDLLIDDPQPSKELIVAFNNVLAAQRKKEAAQNEAEALKIQMVGEATAEKESLVLKAESFIAYRSKIAEGNKEAMGVMLGKGRMVQVEDKFVYEEIPAEKREIMNVTVPGLGNFKKNISLIISKFGDFMKNLFVKKEVVINSGNNLSRLMLINQRLYQKVLLLDSLIEKKFSTGSTIKEKIKKEVSELVSKYLLFYENSELNTSLVNEDIGDKIEAAINLLIKRFNDAKHEFEIDSHIREIDNLIEVYEKI